LLAISFPSFYSIGLRYWNNSSCFKRSRPCSGDHLILLAGTAADTDCAYYFAVLFQWNASSKNHDPAMVEV
jgi:hypothetical protein